MMGEKKPKKMADELKRRTKMENDRMQAETDLIRAQTDLVKAQAEKLRGKR